MKGTVIIAAMLLSVCGLPSIAEVASQHTQDEAKTTGEIPTSLDAVFARYVQLGKDVGELLEKVQDKQSAAASVSALQAILPRVGNARREIGGIDKLQPDVAQAVSAKYEKSMREAWGKAFDGIYRLQKARCYEEVAFFRAFSILCSLLDS